ncbi:hypothetical protein K1719_045053 [Acacia pycnantha]|nr:hypothetical protein K1719_045053 [Acacia pycnantha]
MMGRRIQDLSIKVGIMSVIDLRNDYYVVDFMNEEDYNLAIIGGLWKIFDPYLTVREWCPNFDPMKATIDEDIWRGSAFIKCTADMGTGGRAG